jgi:hypothetical protein
MDQQTRLELSIPPATARHSPARWGAERRLEFIDFRLLWDGTINRGQLVDFFGISIQQASADLARYAEQAPGNLAYDKSAKTYRAAAGFEPLLGRTGADHFLNQLHTLATCTAPGTAVFIGWRPPCDVVRYPARPVETGTLLQLLWAIRDGSDIHLSYQSMRRPSASERWIAPHALASDGLRWHVRAWCHESEDFRDFVLSRIQAVGAPRLSAIDPAADDDWHNRVDVIVRPRAGLSVGQRSAVEADYGMREGRLVLNCRRALAFYVVRQLHLDQPSDATIAEQPLELENRTELSALIAAARKVPEEQARTARGSQS